MAGILEQVLFDAFNGHQMWDFAAFLSYIILKGFYLGFGLLVEQNKTFWDVSLAPRTLKWAFSLFFCVPRPNMVSITTQN